METTVDNVAGTSNTVNRDFNVRLMAWTVGGGVEYMLSPNWTMKVEYLHFDFNNAADTAMPDNTW